jgi:hypothetical protein
MRSINGVSALAAVIIVVAYLIARPHIGTVWYMTANSPVATPDPASSPLPPGLTRFIPANQETPPPTRFIDLHDCFVNGEELFQITHPEATHVHCATENALLWGW